LFHCARFRKPKSSKKGGRKKRERVQWTCHMQPEQNWLLFNWAFVTLKIHNVISQQGVTHADYPFVTALPMQWPGCSMWPPYF